MKEKVGTKFVPFLLVTIEKVATALDQFIVINKMSQISPGHHHNLYW